MTLPTHLAFASALYLGGAELFGYRPDAVGWALAAVACLLPDVDLPTSKVGRLCGFLAVPLERRFGHRTLTHSAVAWRWPAGSISLVLNYLLGEMEMADARAQARIAILSSIETYNPASYRGGILTLHLTSAPKRSNRGWTSSPSRAR